MTNPLTLAVARVKDTMRSWLGNWPMSEFPRVFGQGSTSTGVSVSEYSALNYSAVWSAVSLVAGDIASLPLILYKRTSDGGKDRYVDSNLYELLHDAPNPEMGAMVFRESLQAHVMTWGNAYAEIQRDGLSRPVALWPITPDRVTPFRDEVTKQLRYRVTNAQGKQSVLLPRNMLHVPGLGFDGVTGYSVIQQARESIALGMATERFGGTFFGNGSTFGGILSHPGKLTTEVKQGIRESIDATHTGVDRAHRFVILGDGMKYDKLGIPPNDAQFLETRKFQVTEIARWFQIPPHKLADLERATFSNIEQQDIEYYRSCLRRWLVRWEQELNRKLISPLERKQQFFKHNAEGILRGDSAARSTFYREMFNIGAYSINMILDSEDLNPIGAEGDVHFVQGNLMPADAAQDITPAPNVTDITPQPAQLGPTPADQQQQQNALHDLLSEIAANTAALQASMAAEREAMSAAERAQHEKRLADLKADRDSLQHQFDDYRTQHATDADVLTAQLETARTETTAERAARATVEAALLAAEAARATAVTETADARTAREAAEQCARTETDARAAAETTSHATIDAAKADADAARVKAEQAAADARTADHKREAAEHARAEAETQAAINVGLHAAAAIEQAKAEAGRVKAEQDAAAAIAARVEADQKRDAAEQAERQAAATLIARREAETARLTGMLTAHRALIVDAMQRVIAPEVDRARKHQATAEKLRHWSETFYVTYEDKCLETLKPAIRAHLAWKQSTEDVDAVTLVLVREHITESQRLLRAIIDGEPDEMHANLERMLQRWEQDRPNAVADHVLKEEIAFLRSYR